MDQKNIQNARRTGTIPKIKHRNNSNRQSSVQTNINQEFETHQQFDSNVENWPHPESSESSKLTARKQSAENIGMHQRDQKNEEYGKQLNQIQEYLHIMMGLKNQQENSNENTSFKKMRNQIGTNQINTGYNQVIKSKTLPHEKLQMFNENTEMHMSAPIRTNDYNNSRNPESEIAYTSYMDSLSNSGDSVKSFNANQVEYLKSKKYILDTLQKQIKNDTEREEKIIHPIGSEDNYHDEYEIFQKDLDNKKKLARKLIMDIKNSEETKNEFGGKLKKIAYMQQKLDDLKNTHLLPEHVDNLYGYDCCSKMDNIIHEEVKEKNHPHECYNGTCYFDSSQQENRVLSKKQVNKKYTVKSKEFMELQSEVNARKKELKNMISKTRATVNLNQHSPLDNKIDRSENTFLSEYLAMNHLATTMSDAANNHIDNIEVNSYNGNNSNTIRRCYYPAAMPFSCNKQRGDASETPLTTERQSEHSSSCEFYDFLTSSQNPPSKVRNQLESIKIICETMLSEASGCDFNKKVESGRSSAGQICFDLPHMQKKLINSRDGYGIRSNSSPTQSNSSKVQNWMDSNAEQTNAFMINSLHMCCEMLNLQQKEIVSLKKTVDSIQNVNHHITKPDSGYSTCRTLNSNHISPNEINGTNNFINVSPRPQNFRKINSSVENYLDNGNDQYCSDLNEEQISFPINYNPPKQPGYNRKNLENNFKIPAQCYHPSLESSNENLQSHMWRRSEALNNQVAPGIRTNNYWDNFRSYSRQNLLSRKCNENLQRDDLLIEGLTQEQPPMNRGVFAVSKDKSIHDLSVPQQIEVNAPDEIVQPANISRISNMQNDDFDVEDKPQEEEFSCLDNSSIIGSFLNFCSEAEDQEKQNCKPIYTEQKLENICYGESQPDTFAMLNYPEEMRENIYKEVAVLISSNQNRLEYLIQIFKDLQFIKSDGMRRKLMRKIKSLISESNPTVTINQSNDILVEPEINKDDDTHYHSVSANNTEVLEISTESMKTYQEAIPEIVDFLNNHDDEHLSHSMILALHQILNDITIPAVLVEVNTKNIKLDQFMIPLLSHWLQNFNGKLVKNIKTRIFYKIHGTLNDMKQLHSKEIKEAAPNIEPTLDLPVSNFNEDLAEADQITKVSDGYEEGAVGGIINSIVVTENHPFWGDDEIKDEPASFPLKVYPG